jgi:hypothetical protein
MAEKFTHEDAESFAEGLRFYQQLAADRLRALNVARERLRQIARATDVTEWTDKSYLRQSCDEAHRLATEQVP